MGGIGIVNNPRALRNQRSPETALRLRALLDGEGEVVDATTADELASAVERFRARGIDLLGVSGGDGTSHLVLSAFAGAYGDEPLPAVALLRGGGMNTVADANKVRGSPEVILRAILERRRAGGALRTLERDLLSIEGEGVPPRVGFLFGTGAAVAFLEAYYRRSPTPLSAALLAVRAVASSLTGGGFAEALTSREPLRVVADGEEWPDASYLSVLAGSVPEIGFGFSPFARCDEQPGFFHAVGVTGSPLQVAAHLPHIWAGRPWRRQLAMDGVVRDLIVEGPSSLRFMVDGDLYAAPGPVRVRTGPPVRVVVP